VVRRSEISVEAARAFMVQKAREIVAERQKKEIEAS
jgi:hypothetical protein